MSYKIKRVPDWEQRFNKWITDNKHKSFKWGEWDCGLMAASNISNLTDFDVYDEFAGNYDDEKSAYVFLKNKRGFIGLCNKVLGESINPNFARRGDIILSLFDEDVRTLMVKGATCFYGITTNGIMEFKRNQFKILRAWRVG